MGWMPLPVFIPVLLALTLPAAPATPAADNAGQVLSSYLTAFKSQSGRLNGSTTEVHISAEIPRLRQQGRLSAIRRISQIGRVTYDILRFEGDKSVKNHVIANYLSAEVQVREAGDASMSIVPQNYKFSYKGAREWQGRSVHIFELKPRAKRKGLFKGMLWVDSETYLPVRETGRLVKNPSIFIKKVQFTRDYQVHDGLALVTRLETTVETRMAGAAKMTVEYVDFKPEVAEAGGGSPQCERYF